jgi:phosphinothricin acetyltransferase
MSWSIRLAEASDAGQVQAIYAPFCIDSVVSFEETAPSVDEMRQRMSRTLEHLPWLVCVNGQRVLGYAYAGRHRERAAYRWSVEVSAYVAEGERGRGVGKALYAELLRLVRVQGYVNAYAGITLPNPASVRLHEAVGFVPVGVYRSIGYKRGAWHDVGWWQLALRPHPADPAEPLSLAETLRAGAHTR